ncbi:hypothetical protein EAH89_16330 [Roseomonas nepalensis]|uniref:Peroxidase n=1 Tax=Muricoccus nepalensis TaxID=1854500 RepID=A0A502FX63_9PROT|nr:hypothetical protein [Roseomonas nepalensis]TPG53533.1 hypothetical protein EAH89_16330 [Roseomonas nepalensis]
MADLAAILDEPVSWTAAATDADLRTFLSDLQANILKGHGRSHAAHLFLTFDGMAPGAVAALVRAMGAHCTSAYAQLLRNRRNPPYLDGGPVRCFFLSARGYRALGPHAGLPAGEAFAAGMAARREVLGDPERARWDRVGWRDGEPDALILLANAHPAAVTEDLEIIESWLNGTGARILVIERGLQQHRRFRPDADPEGVEHFGYVDGRSQPLFLREDLDRERQALAAEPGGEAWSPAFKPSQFIVADPNGRTPHAAGSYFVFRKLEQDVRGFNAAEDALARALFGKPTAQQSDRAGAMVVGRFEDGTPLTLHDGERRQAVPNGFTYADDPKGAKCPFHAHIRKTNPRGDIRRELKLPDDAADRAPIMARRGITYGAPRPMSADGSEFADAGREPQHDSGLLFMAYMASLEAGFEFTQRSWANNPSFVGNLNPAAGRPSTGVDPVIGQTATAAERAHRYLDGHTPGAVPKTLSFENFVHLKGGEYFFAPSLSFLRSVGL